MNPTNTIKRTIMINIGAFFSKGKQAAL